MIDLYGIPDGEIPIFFTTDDNYIPFLDVAVSSLIRNASEDYRYRVIILNTGIRQENIDLVKRNEREGFTVDFVDISEQVKDIQSRFKNVYHFSVVTYYRLVIASMFPSTRRSSTWTATWWCWAISPSSTTPT